MAITKTEEINGYQLDNMKVVFANIDTVIKEDGKEISRSRTRKVLPPNSTDKNADGSWTSTDTDISGETAEIQAICNAVWTDAVKAAYIALSKANLGG